MLEGLKYLYRVLLVLNDTDMNPAAVKTWRRFVGAVVSILLLGSIGCLCWAQGWIPGVSGVALASDLTNLSKRVDAQQASLEQKQDRTALLIVKSSIRTALNDRCTALARRNQAALNGANNALDDLAEQYRDLTGRDLIIPDCHVVLIDNHAQ